MLRVDSFLSCSKLETGGLIIGWVTLIQNVIGFFLSLIGLVLMGVMNCSDFKDRFGGKDHMDFDQNCSVLKTVIISLLILGLIFAVLFAWMSYLLLKGIENRNPSHVRPMMILMAVISILSFLNILSFTSSAVVSGLLWGVIYGYMFVVLYSLYATFKEEKGGICSTTYRQSGGNV